MGDNPSSRSWTEAVALRNNEPLLQLLLRPELIGVSTLAFPAVGSLLVESGVTLATDHFVAIVLHSKYTERWFNHHDFSSIL